MMNYGVSMTMMKKEVSKLKKQYETIIIFKTSTNEDTIKSVTDVCQEFSKDKKAKTTDLGIKNLAYTVKNERKGHYIQIIWECNADSSSDVSSSFEKELKSNDEVLKFITIRMDDEDEVKEVKDKSEQPDALDVLLGLAKYN